MIKTEYDYGYEKGKQDGQDVERARIVGLFDAEKLVAEQRWPEDAPYVEEVYQRIIEGLRGEK